MTWPDVHYKKLTVPAWEVCKTCRSKGSCILVGECPTCQGEGGKWHEAVVNAEGFAWLKIGWAGTSEKELTRSTILYQLYDPCGECGGKGDVEKLTGMKAGKHYFTTIDCIRCLKDSDGNPTGAAEGTGQGWKIEEDEK